jgi:predicted phosphodiesterase
MVNKAKSRNPHASEVIDKLVEAFPNASSRALGIKAHKEHPALFNSAESARSMVRLRRGAAGKDLRAYATHAPTKHTVAGMPKSIPTFVDWGPYEMLGPAKVLILSDIHVPFHDETAIELAVNKGKSEGCTRLLLNGDIADNHAISRWQTNPEERNFGEEINKTIEMLRYLKSEFSRSTIVWKMGNHEERYDAYMQQKAPEFLGVDAFKWENVYDTAKLGIHVVKDCRPVNVGKLPVLHGHEYQGGGNPKTPALNLYNKAKRSAMCGHYHRLSEHQEKDLDEREHTTYVTGCLCQLRYRYRPINNSTHGFAMVEIDKEGAWSVENKKIYKGKVR